MPRWLLIGLLAPLLGVGVGLALAPNGCCGVECATVAFRCEPTMKPAGERCPDEFSCCSDDPAAVGGGLPQFESREDIGGAVPLFADANNDFGAHGQCVRTAHIPVGVTLRSPSADGCPIPCNPTWDSGEVEDVCGSSSFECCQTVELHADDCVFDEVEQRFRPANGQDALDSLAGGSNWQPTEESTHQDPDFEGCEAHADGDRGSVVFLDCVAQLGVADQRGFCMSVAGCPIASESYVDPCEAMNQ